jgi:hypothetical protein
VSGFLTAVALAEVVSRTVIYLAVISTRSESALTLGCGVRLSTAVTAYT